MTIRIGIDLPAKQQDHPRLDRMVQRVDSSLVRDSEVFGLSFIWDSEAVNCDYESSIYVVERPTQGRREVNKSDLDQWVPDNDYQSKSCEEGDQSSWRVCWRDCWEKRLEGKRDGIVDLVRQNRRL